MMTNPGPAVCDGKVEEPVRKHMPNVIQPDITAGPLKVSARTPIIEPHREMPLIEDVSIARPHNG
jgi:hypothetical protein